MRLSSYLLVMLVYYVQVQYVKSEVIKHSAKHFYTAEAKIDVVQNVANKAMGQKVIEILADSSLSIQTANGKNVKVKDIFLDDRYQSDHLESLLKQQNQSFNQSHITHTVQKHSEVLLSSFNILSTKFGNDSGSFDSKLQLIFDRIFEIDVLINDLAENLNSSSEIELGEAIYDTLVKYQHSLPHQKLADLTKSLDIDVILPLMTKILPNGICGSKITKTQAIMQFYDYLMTNVMKGHTFFKKCNYIKELLSGASSKKKKKQPIIISIETHIQQMFTSMMNRVEHLFIPDIPADYDGIYDGCILDLKCVYSGTFCKFNDLNLNDENAPITISTKHNMKAANEIQFVTFSSSCTLNFIPNGIFQVIFPKFDYLQVHETKLNQIEPDFFLNATNLKHFNCNYNRVSKLPAKSFIHASNLEDFHFNSNGLQEIHHNAFLGLTKVKTIDLANNKLKALSFEVFRPLTALNNLHLQNNICINKLFSGLNGLETELEVTSKCGINDMIDQNNRKQTFEINILSAKLSKLENGQSFLNNEESIKNIDEKFRKLENKMEKLEQKLSEILNTIGKLVAASPAPVENNV